MGKKLERCANGTRRNKKTKICEGTLPQITMSKYFEIVKTLLKTSKVYYSNLDTSDEEVEEPPNELMRVHLSGALKILVGLNLVKPNVLESINNFANRAFMEMMIEDNFDISGKKMIRHINEINKWMGDNFTEKGEDPLVVSHDGIIYFWAIKKNIHLFPVNFLTQ